MLELDETYNGKNVELQISQQFEIRLPEIPTTGFQWKLVSSGEPACVALDNFYEQPQIHSLDSEGKHYWRFQAAHEGLGNIELVYQRPWEQGAAPMQQFRLGVHITAQ